ncbi:(4Fe-4S)-binding protein, partial [Escherichia coli]
MDQALLDGGYRCYTGEKIDVYFNTAICQHSGNCVRGNGKLFNLKRKPWIMPDEVDVATVVKVIGNDSNLLIVFYVQIMPDD